MNPKAKLAIVIAIPVLVVWLWIFSLFKLLSPADVSWEVEKVKNVEEVKKANELVLPTWSNNQTNKTWVIVPGNAWSIIKPLVVKELRIAMPIWLYNKPGWTPIINKLSQQKIRVSIITNTRDQKYDDFVQWLLASGATGADIILMNNDQLEDMSQYAGSFGFSQDISTLFPYLFFDYLKRTDYTFVPFGIDPMVTFAKNPISENSQSIDRSQIVNESLSNIDVKKLTVQIPILFGLATTDLQLIGNKNEIFEWYTDILKNVVYQSSNRSELISTLKSYSNDLLEVKLWDPVKYKSVLAKLIERNPKCEYYPSLCFVHFKLTNFAFGYLSDLDILNGYFEKSEYAVYNFPNSSSVYPVRLRGWVVNKAWYDRLVKVDQDGVSLAGVFFQEYITQATNGNHYLRPTLFSAFNVVLANQESDLQRKYISQFQSKRQPNPIKLETDQQYEQLLALLKGDYDISVFLAGLRN